MAYEIPKMFLYNDHMMLDTHRIENYVQHHPKCRRVDICKTLEILPGSVSSALTKLAKQGKVRRVKKDGADSDWVWEPGADANYVPKESIPYGIPIQKTVSEWTPETRRDELVGAFFGPAKP